MKKSAFLALLAVLLITFGTLARADDISSDVAMDITQADKRAARVSPTEFLKELKKTLADPEVQHDIDPQLFDDFWLKWELVTTRYKPDGNELRFMYVNDIGAEALAKGKYPFPEGTVFTKIGALAEHDAIFDNSLIPGPINRVQVMLKKKDDPNARDGWVYSLYLPGGIRGHLKPNEIDACHACHEIAKDRDYVFSVPFPGPFGAAMASDADSLPFKDRFKETAVADLKENARKIMATAAPDIKTVKLLEMPAFGGTIYESRELLTRFARTGKSAHILASPDDKFVLAALPRDNNCILMVSIPTTGNTPALPEYPGASVWKRCE